MRLAAQLMVAICMWAVVGSSHAIAQGQMDRPERPQQSAGQVVFATIRQNAFTIPFRVEPTTTPAETPVEVQLHVSANQAASWELAAKVEPQKGSFDYRAPHDGEYWFCIRTVDRQGVVRPEGPPQAQLKVTVDTIAPRLDMSAVRGEAGEVVARWQAVDPNLNPRTFMLEYRGSNSSNWESVATTAPPSPQRHTLTGEATWWPKAAADSITVRATIKDHAGNPATSQAVVKLGGAAGNGQRADLSGQPNAGKPSDVSRWPADRVNGQPVPPPSQPDGSWRGSDLIVNSGARVPAQAVAQSTVPRGTSQLDFSVLPPGERPRMVNARAFEVEYEVDEIGPSGIGKVELWGTRDGGRTWSLAANDPDTRSPMSVNVPDEGVFGFRIVVQNKNGLGGRPPVDGDLPEIWIGVDLTRPTGRITAADLSLETGELTIQWEAYDDVPDPRPVTLSFSAAPGGPWTSIAAGLENTGAYRWKLDSRLPDKLYLRMEVRDEAGNIAAFDLAEPVVLDRSRPQGRIRAVKPAAS